MPRGTNRTKQSPSNPQPFSAEEEAHIAKLYERCGGALTVEQIRATYAMSLGHADANGRKPSSREQLGATKVFADILLPKPKADPQERVPTIIQVVSPYHDGEFIEMPLLNLPDEEAG